MPISEEMRARMMKDYGAKAAAPAARGPVSGDRRGIAEPHYERAPVKKGGFKKFLAWTAAIGAGLTLWFGGQKQGEAKVYREAAQPQGMQLILQQHQRPTVGQVVQASYEDSVVGNLLNGKTKNALKSAKIHGKLKTEVAGHAMGLPEKAARVASAQMDTQLAWEDASQAEARASAAHSNNETMWEHTAGRVHNVQDTVGEVRGTVDEVHGLVDAFKGLIGKDR